MIDASGKLGYYGVPMKQAFGIVLAVMVVLVLVPAQHGAAETAFSSSPFQ